MLNAFRIITVLLFFAAAFPAQIVAPHVKNFTTKDYGTLRSPEVWSIAQDDNGLMYFGFVNEIGVFDGINWQFISIPNGLNITSLIHVNGIVYYGAYGSFGMLKPDAKGHLEVQVLSEGTSEKFSNVWRIHPLGQGVIFQAEEIVYIYDDNTLKAVKPKTSFHLSFECAGHVYVRQRGVGLMEIKEGGMELVNDNPLLKEYGIFDAFLIGEDKTLIVTTELGFRFSNKDFTASLVDVCEDGCQYAINKGIIGAKILAPNLWVAYSVTSGCYFINDSGELLGQLDLNSGLSSEEIKDAFVDQNGKLWLATGNGVAKVEVNEPFEFLNEEFGINGNAQCITSYQGRKFVGTSLGLVEEMSPRSLRFTKTTLNSQIWDLLEVKGKLFIAASSGLYWYSEEEGYTKIYDGNFNTLYYDPTNLFLLVGMEGGILVLDEFSNWQPISSFAFGGNKKTKIAFDAKNDCFWVGSNSAGILQIKFDGFDFSYKVYGVQEGDGLRVGESIIPFEIEESCLFGTPYDLLEFTNEEEAIAELKVSGAWNDTMQNHPEFYPGTFFESKKYFIGSSRNYQYYLQNGDLIMAVIENQIGHFQNPEIFDVQRFQTVELGRINFMRLEEDGLYVGGSNGMSKIQLLDLLNLDSLKRYVNINLRSIVYNDSMSVGVYGDYAELEIPFFRNKITFEYASNTIHNDRMPYYSWRLVGDDDRWSEWTNNTTIDFKNLVEGDYTFEVKAMDVYGNESEVKQFHFKILTPWYRTVLAYIGYFVLFGLVVYLAIVLGRKRLKAQNVRLEEIVEERTAEIRVKNTELEKSYHEIAEQKQEITDSINYAQRIQQAILPLSENIGQYIEEYFVLFKPKDIVSGDFYWFAHTNDKSIFVCADCTGHGVPGAFMSMIGSDKLNQAVLEAQLTNPAEILSFVNKGIKKSLKQKEEEEGSSRDGMDVTIASIDTQNMRLQVGGANNSLLMIRDGELTEFKATKTAVAGFTPENQIYELVEAELKKGDCLYMTTDGYPDQFGGDKGKKLKIAVFKKVLMDICHLSMAEQKAYLTSFMNDWMGDLEQIDDICVVGIRI